MRTPTCDTILVTGANSGIGRELALQLARSSHQVLALGRDAARLRALAQVQPGLVPLVQDLADTRSLEALAAQLMPTYPGLSRVVRNAGIQYAQRKDATGYSPQQIDAKVSINLLAPLRLTHALLAHLLRQPRAQPVFMGSWLAFAPKSTAAIYSATKAGLHQFAQALRVQHRHLSLHVMEAVLPLVDTPMTQGRSRNKLPADRAAAALVYAMEQRRDEAWVGAAAALPWLLPLAPSLVQHIMLKN